MGAKVGEEIRTEYDNRISDETLTAYVLKAGVTKWSGSMTEYSEDAAGLYYYDWTPNAAGVWVVRILKGTQKLDSFSYHVEMGQEEDIEDKVDTVDSVVDAIKAVTDALPDAGALNDLATILADTNELQTDWKDGGRLDLLIDGIKAATDRLTGSEAAGPYSYLDAGGEQDVYENAAVTRRKVALSVSNRNMTKTGVFRIYRKENAVNYDLWIEQPVTVGAGDERVWDKEFKTNQHWKITYEEDADEGAARDIPYNVILEAME